MPAKARVLIVDASRESRDILRTLMKLHRETGDHKFLEPVPRAIKYYQSVRLPEGQLARFYELKTNKPLYMTRRGKAYSLTYDDSNLPSHYGWKTDSRIDVLEKAYKAAHRGDATPIKTVEQEDVRRIISAIDKQGRWISTFAGEPLVGDQKFRPGDRYISSAVLSENLELLSEYLLSIE